MIGTFLLMVLVTHALLSALLALEKRQPPRGERREYASQIAGLAAAVRHPESRMTTQEAMLAWLQAELGRRLDPRSPEGEARQDALVDLVGDWEALADFLERAVPLVDNPERPHLAGLFITCIYSHARDRSLRPRWREVARRAPEEALAQHAGAPSTAETMDLRIVAAAAVRRFGVDPLDREILMGLLAGETKEAVAARLGIDRKRVYHLRTRLVAWFRGET